MMDKKEQTQERPNVQDYVRIKHNHDLARFEIEVLTAIGSSEADETGPGYAFEDWHTVITLQYRDRGVRSCGLNLDGARQQALDLRLAIQKMVLLYTYKSNQCLGLMIANDVHDEVMKVLQGQVKKEKDGNES